MFRSVKVLAGGPVFMSGVSVGIGCWVQCYAILVLRHGMLGGIRSSRVFDRGECG